MDPIVIDVVSKSRSEKRITASNGRGKKWDWFFTVASPSNERE
jgi:hypothetical protein